MLRHTLQPLALAGLCCLSLTAQAGEDSAAISTPGEQTPPPLRPLPESLIAPEPEPQAETKAKEEAETDTPWFPWLMLAGGLASGFLLGCGVSSRPLRRLCEEQLTRIRATCSGILPPLVRRYRRATNKTPMPSAPKPESPKPHAPDAEAPASPPPYFRTPFPTRYRHKLTTAEVAAMVQKVTARNTCPPFHKLCLVANSGDARAVTKLHHRYAKAFLKRHGEPTGKPEHKSLLLQARPGERFWFFGDIHCCHAALTKALCYVLQECAQDPGKATHTLIFCGDLIDRGPESLRTLSTLFCLLLEPPPRLRVHFIRGNHDAALSLTPSPTADKPPFRSIVEPSETSRELNTLWKQEPRLALLMGKAFIRLAEISPCMGEVLGLDTQHRARTLLFTHGGLPHTDLQQQLSQADAALNQEQPTRAQRYNQPYTDTLPENLRAAAARDFTWVRLAETAPHKEADRSTSGCTMGTEDVCDFRRQHWQRTGRVLSYIIRGHDHEFTGFKLYSYDREFLPPDTDSDDMQTECGVLTLNTMDPKPGANLLYARHRIALAGVRSSPSPAVDITLMDTHT